MIYKTRVLILISVFFSITNSCTKNDDFKKNDITFTKSVEIFGIKILATNDLENFLIDASIILI